MAGTTTKAGSNGRLITREDLQAAYAQVMGEGEATARAAAPRGLAVAGRRRHPAHRRWPSWPAGVGAAPSRPWSRSGGSDVDVLLRRFLRAGVRRGVAGNWYWFLLAGATFFLRRVLNDRSSAVSSVTVSPGEQVLITVRDRNAATRRPKPERPCRAPSRRGSGCSSSTPRTAATC